MIFLRTGTHGKKSPFCTTMWENNFCYFFPSIKQANPRKNNRNMLFFGWSRTKDHGPKILDKSPGKVLDMAFNKNFGRQVSWSFRAFQRLHVERMFFFKNLCSSFQDFSQVLVCLKRWEKLWASKGGWFKVIEIDRSPTTFRRTMDQLTIPKRATKRLAWIQI